MEMNISSEIQELADDLLSPDMPVASGQFPTMPTPSNMSINRSLENILLDASPMDESIDLGSSETMLTLEPVQSSSLSSIVSKAEGQVEDGVQGESNVVVEISTCESEAQEDEKGEECLESTSDQVTERVSFVDIVSPSETSTAGIVEKVTEAGEHLVGSETMMESFGKLSIGEAVPVGFVEEKGLRAAESNRSLMKFFTDTSGGTDIEGKGFFDSFTTGEAGDDPSMISPSHQPTDMEKSLSSLTSSVPPSPSVIIPQSTLTGPGASPVTKPPFFQVPALSSGNSTELEAEVRRHMSVEGIPLVETAGPEQNPDDVFLCKMTDDDRQFNAWIPSEMTRQSLISILTSRPGVTIPQTQLTMLGVVIEESLGDPVLELVQRYLGEVEANRQFTLNAKSVSQDAAGLCQLIKGGCLRSAVDLTSELLKQCGQGPDAQNQVTKHTPYSLQLWFCRLALLMKLKLFPQAEREFEPFGNLDSPDLYYEYYQDTFPMRRGSLVPFEMRILHAELPQHVTRPQDSLDRLCYMMAVVTKMLSNLNEGMAEDGSMIELTEASCKASKELWQTRETRILYSLGSCLLNMKDYGAAIDIYKKLMLMDEKNRAELLCAIGRIYLQMGDTEQASHYFHEVETSSNETNTTVKCRNLLNRGLVALGNNQFLEAYQLFKEVTELDKTNIVAVNNMAVCSLYLGRLKESLGFLESLVYADPAHNLQEGILLNLSTLYELESSRALQKKQSLLSLVNEHRGNGFNVNCLKLA